VYIDDHSRRVASKHISQGIILDGEARQLYRGYKHAPIGDTFDIEGDSPKRFKEVRADQKTLLRVQRLSTDSFEHHLRDVGVIVRAVEEIGTRTVGVRRDVLASMAH